MKQQKKEDTWWKEAIVYQIYPRSFQDSNGDGIGDLQGIIRRLDYVKSLGVDVIWLNPVFGSPNCDNGYDISDYYSIMPEFGHMDDFDRLLTEIHKHGLKLVLDLVVNHTSDQHAWFTEASRSRNNPCYHYYHWWPEEKGEPPLRPGYFEESAWTYHAPTRSWYLHYFSAHQPDLNWENPEVREAVYKMMRFWFDKGIDGFRMDSIPLISKDTAFPPINKKKYPDLFSYYAHGPHLHDYLHEMNREVLSRYPVMTVGEGSALTSEDVAVFVEPGREELDMVYGFGPSEVRNYTSPDAPDTGIPYSLVALKKMFTDWDKAVGTGWPAIYLGNHDQPRMLSRFGNDTPDYRKLSAQMLATFLLTMRGTPYWFAGDEIGMKNIRFEQITDYNDIDTLNHYRELVKKGESTSGFLEQQKETGRDNARTPFQWDASLYAGFSVCEPWLKVNPDYQEINVATEELDPDSVLNYFRKLTALRKTYRALTDGKYILLDPENIRSYTYVRETDGEKIIVMLNFSSFPAVCRVKIFPEDTEILLDNYGSYRYSRDEAELRPYEAIVAKCRR